MNNQTIKNPAFQQILNQVQIELGLYEVEHQLQKNTLHIKVGDESLFMIKDLGNELQVHCFTHSKPMFALVLFGACINTGLETRIGDDYAYNEDYKPKAVSYIKLPKDPNEVN